MINYEDVLLLKILTNGAFWCNENVYCIAKELQLLSLKLDDWNRRISHRKSSFGMLRVVLKRYWVRDIFINNEIYGPVVADHAVLPQGAMRNLSEAASRKRFDKFKENWPEALKIEDESNKGNLCHESWKAIKEHAEKYKFIENASVFKDSMGKHSELWRYWSIFQDMIMPVVINLTQSFRDTDWELHLSTIPRAMSQSLLLVELTIVAGFLCTMRTVWS